MAITATQLGRTNVTGNRHTVALSLAFAQATGPPDTRYKTGGEALDLTSYVANIESVSIESLDGYVLQYDRANKKVKAFESGADGTANDEVGNNSTALNGKTAYLTVTGGRA